MELIKSSAYQVRSITSNDSSVFVGDRRSLDWIWSKSTRDRMVGEWRDLGLRFQDFCFWGVRLPCWTNLYEENTISNGKKEVDQVGFKGTRTGFVSKWCVQMGFSGKRVWIQLDRACTRQ